MGFLLVSVFLIVIFILYRQKAGSLRTLLEKNIEITTLKKNREYPSEENYATLEPLVNEESIQVPGNEEVQIKEDKYTKHTLSDHLKKKILKDIKHQLEVKKIYLNSELSLKELSAAVNSNRGYVSQVINEEYGDNFYNIINEYRINEARQLFLSPHKKDASINDIAFEVGFNSADVFIRAFKKITGLTPAYYKKNALK